MYTTAGKPKMQGKKPSHRRAVLGSLIIELIRNEKLQTTPLKAKLLKQQFDTLVTEAKKNTPASRRAVEARLRNEKTIAKFYGKILPRLSDVNSGYVYSARTLPRKGDNADQTILMLRGYEVREKRSRLAAALERREKKEAQKDEKSVRGRLRGAVSKVTPPSEGKKHESVEQVRRVST